MTPEQEAHRGDEAARLLENDLLKDALAAIEADVVKQWQECPARDQEGKEALWQLMKTAQKFRRILIGHIETGKLARENMKRHEESRLARMGRALRRV